MSSVPSVRSSEGRVITMSSLLDLTVVGTVLYSALQCSTHLPHELDERVAGT